MDNIQGQTFHLFPDLPFELRLKIWSETLTQSWRDETQPKHELPAIFFYNPRALLWQPQLIEPADGDEIEGGLDESATVTYSGSARPKTKVRLQFEHWRLDKLLIKTPVIASVNREARAIVLNWARKRGDLTQVSPGDKDVDADSDGDSNVDLSRYLVKEEDEGQSELKDLGKDVQQQQQQQQQQQHRQMSDQRCLFVRRFNPNHDALFVSIKQWKSFIKEPKILGTRLFGDVASNDSSFGVRFMVVSSSALHNIAQIDFASTKLEKVYVVVKDIPHKSGKTGDDRLIIRKHWFYTTHWKKKSDKLEFSPFVWNGEQGQFDPDLETDDEWERFGRPLYGVCDFMVPHLIRNGFRDFEIWPVEIDVVKSL